VHPCFFIKKIKKILKGIFCFVKIKVMIISRKGFAKSGYKPKKQIKQFKKKNHPSICFAFTTMKTKDMNLIIFTFKN